MAATVVSNELFGAPGMSDTVVFHPGLVGITRKISFAAANADASKAYAFIAVPKGFVITGLFAEETEACKAGTLTFKIADAADSANDKAVGSAVTVGGSAPARVAQNLATPVVANEGAIVSLISSVAQTDGTVDVEVTITNKGKRDGVEIAQLYIRDCYSSVTRPVKELKDFARVELKAGESKRVKFTITPDKLRFYNIDMERVVEPGEFKVMVGSSSRDKDLQTASFVVE
jgi:hypothetical protein